MLLVVNRKGTQPVNITLHQSPMLLLWEFVLIKSNLKKKASNCQLNNKLKVAVQYR